MLPGVTANSDSYEEWSLDTRHRKNPIRLNSVLRGEQRNAKEQGHAQQTRMETPREINCSCVDGHGRHRLSVPVFDFSIRE